MMTDAPFGTLASRDARGANSLVPTAIPRPSRLRDRSPLNYRSSTHRSVDRGSSTRAATQPPCPNHGTRADPEECIRREVLPPRGAAAAAVGRRAAKIKIHNVRVGGGARRVCARARVGRVARGVCVRAGVRADGTGVDARVHAYAPVDGACLSAPARAAGYRAAASVGGCATVVAGRARRDWSAAADVGSASSAAGQWRGTGGTAGDCPPTPAGDGAAVVYALHGPRSRRGSRRDASSRAWTFGQRVAGCSGEGSGGGTVMSPISTASSAAGMRARVAAQYLGASSR